MNGMFTDRVKKVMQLAREESVRLGNDYVGTEHLLLGLFREGGGVAIVVFKTYNVDFEEVTATVERSVSTSGGMMTIGQMIPFTPKAKKILEIAAQEARSMGHKYIGTEHILLAILKDGESVAANCLADYNMEYNQTKEEVERILHGGDSTSKDPQAKVDPAMGAANKKKNSKTPFLEHFGRDLTLLASEGRLDPIVGRHEEVERMVQILCRRRKNNPVLIGEPGVGKTAIVEGLAQRINDKHCPEILESKRIWMLDIAAIVAGTKYRGQFEERIKSMMLELQKNPEIIIFIDELHTIVGAGGSEGSLDASNIFKPALARGELQCIGATTLDEYRKYIEKDGALERRFQTIIVEPPKIEEAIEILMGLRPQYEQHHKVTYTDEALRKAVILSERYINDRALPDKAVDVLDEAGSRIRLSSITAPPELRELETKLADLLAAKTKAIDNQDFRSAADIRDQQDKLEVELAQLRSSWKTEQKNQQLVVDEKAIRDVIATMTGIPLKNMEGSEVNKVLNLEEELRDRVIGQEKALQVVAKTVRRSRAGVQSSKRPMGSFLFLGPTGVGKTELVKTLTETLFGSEDAMIRIDMSEYMEKFTVSRLIGAPPGYVGYDERGGQLTEKVRKKPYCVVLLDEIEKAHPDVFNLLLQILDDGVLTDSAGRKVNFKNTIIVMTSNVGAKFLRKGAGMGFNKGGEEVEYERMQSSITEEIKRVFAPEFINRIDEMVFFRSLGDEDLIKVVEIQLKDLIHRIKDRGLNMELTTEAKLFLVKHGNDALMGARPLRRAIQRYVEDELAEGLLRGLYPDGSSIRIDVADSEEGKEPKNLKFELV